MAALSASRAAIGILLRCCIVTDQTSLGHRSRFRSNELHQAVHYPDRMPPPEAVAAAVARNTRHLRTERGWSLDQLAQRSGVSKGMLVHLEQARTNPSLGTLCKVAETLGVSLAGLIELHEAPIVLIVPPGETVRLWTGDEGSTGDLLAGCDERDHVE